MVSDARWSLIEYFFCFHWFWFCNGFGINKVVKLQKTLFDKSGPYYQSGLSERKCFKVINCYYNSQSRKYMKIQSVLTHREIHSICYVIIFIVELKGRRFEWCESFNIYVRRIIWIRSHIFTFRASDFADNQIIPYGEIILFETQGQASLKPWIYHINKSQSENNI